MNHSATVFTPASSYEIKFRGTRIFRITRYSGENSSQDLAWKDVPRAVQIKFLTEIKKKLQNEKSTTAS